jgi:hypothetical protein
VKVSVIIQGDEATVDKAHRMMAQDLQRMLIERNIPGIVIIVGKTKRRGILVYVPINVDEGELKDIVNKLLIAVSI